MMATLQQVREAAVPPRALNDAVPPTWRRSASNSGESRTEALLQRRGPGRRPAPLPRRRRNPGPAGRPRSGSSSSRGGGRPPPPWWSFCYCPCRRWCRRRRFHLPPRGRLDEQRNLAVSEGKARDRRGWPVDAERRKTEAEKAPGYRPLRYALQIGQVLGDLQDGNPTQRWTGWAVTWTCAAGSTTTSPSPVGDCFATRPT